MGLCCSNREELVLADGPLYLGFDLSTQSCKAVVVDSRFKIVCDARVHFDSDLSHYKTDSGVHRRDGGHVTSPTLMWLEAFELALDQLKSKNCPLDRIAAISGSGQQHGSAYWSMDAAESLRSLSADKGRLAEQLKAAFVVQDSPIWMDTSTSESCRAMEAHVGGPLELSRITGSSGYERFTAHHVRALMKDSPDDFAACSRVSLVSSLGASLLTGKFEAIDASDGAGMNLMDVSKRTWDANILDNFLAGGDHQLGEKIREKLGEKPLDSWTVAGKLHPFYSDRFGFAQDKVQVVHWSGDNPCAAVGLGLVAPGDIAISLGTSDTIYVVLNGLPPKPLPFGHLFPHPLPPHGTFFTMLVYSNGDITRTKVRDEFAGADWEEFTKKVESAPVGNGGQLGIFTTTDEITPPLSSGEPLRAKSQGGELQSLDAFEEPAQNCRAIVEGRALSMRLHLSQLNPNFFAPVAGRQPRLLLTGGGSTNTAIRQVFADVFGRPVMSSDVPDSAAVGAAMRAWHASAAGGAPGQLPEAPTLGEHVVQPRQESAEVYEKMLVAYEQLEEKAKRERSRA